MPCPSNTVWNPKQNECDNPWPEGQLNCTEKPNPDGCCKLGEPIEFRCPPDNSIANSSCDWPYNYNCTEKPDSTTTTTPTIPTTIPPTTHSEGCCKLGKVRGYIKRYLTLSNKRKQV